MAQRHTSLWSTTLSNSAFFLEKLIIEVDKACIANASFRKLYCLQLSCLYYESAISISVEIHEGHKINSAVIIESPHSYHCSRSSTKIGCSVRRMKSCWRIQTGILLKWYLLKWSLQAALWRSSVTARENHWEELKFRNSENSFKPPTAANCLTTVDESMLSQIRCFLFWGKAYGFGHVPSHILPNHLLCHMVHRSMVKASLLEQQ